MKSIKASELTGAALDWAVAKCEGRPEQYLKGFVYEVDHRNKRVPLYSTDWAQGGPIIEREGIATRENGDSDDWYACKRWDNHGKFGATPLIASMRCYVASKMGDTIEVPEELL
jgi:hypothetical protein